jgi:hypothetical protein
MRIHKRSCYKSVKFLLTLSKVKANLSRRVTRANYDEKMKLYRAHTEHWIYYFPVYGTPLKLSPNFLNLSLRVSHELQLK